MELSVVDANQKKKSSVTVSDKCFDAAYNPALIHQVTNAYLAAGRQGTKAQKSRSDVRGGGAKPWRQKGTGRARAGTRSSPIWRSGGVTFAARPRDFTQKVNRKMYRAAVASILSELVRKERLVVIDQIAVKACKTKEVASWLAGMGLTTTKTLLLVKDLEESLYLSARNIPNITVADTQSVDPVSLVRFEKVVITVDGLKQLEETYL